MIELTLKSMNIMNDLMNQSMNILENAIEVHEHIGEQDI